MAGGSLHFPLHALPKGDTGTLQTIACHVIIRWSHAWPAAVGAGDSETANSKTNPMAAMSATSQQPGAQQALAGRAPAPAHTGAPKGSINGSFWKNMCCLCPKGTNFALLAARLAATAAGPPLCQRRFRASNTVIRTELHTKHVASCRVHVSQPVIQPVVKRVDRDAVQSWRPAHTCPHSCLLLLRRHLPPCTCLTVLQELPAQRPAMATAAPAPRAPG